jgi:outer membrane protein
MASSKLFISCLFTVLYASNSFGVTLGESFNSAVLNNQGDNINESRLKQSMELRNKGQGSYYPTLSIRGTYLKQEKFEDQKTLGLNLTTSLYNGGRDRQLIKNADAGVKMAQNQRQLDRVTLYMEVVDAYYTYLLNLNDTKNLELLKKQSQERVDEIRKRLQIGRSRRGELLQAEAQLASVDAQMLDAQGLLKESEARFYILTGLSKDKSIDIKFDQTSPVKTLQEYIDMALAREDIQNKQLEIQQFEGDVKISKGSYLPTLDLLSNWYAIKDGGSTSSRNSDWDVGLNLTIPLYEGGVSQALVRESTEKKQTAQYQLSDYEKTIKIEVTSRYELFHRYFDQIKAFDMALEKAKRSYDETIRDYRLGLVSNLDVLTSLNLYLTNKRNAEKTKILAVLNHKQLEAAAGIIQ